MPKLGCFTIGLFAIPVGALLLGFAMAHDEQRIYARMQPVEAEILELDTRVERRRGSNGHSTRYHVPYPRFAYEVDGREYISRSFSLHDPEYIARDFAEGLLDPYAVGKTVTAYYDPENPGTAVLERRITLFPYFGVLFAGAFFALTPVARTFVLRNKPAVTQAGKFFRLDPPGRLHDRMRAGIICAVVWAVAPIAVLLHLMQSPGALLLPSLIEWGGMAVYAWIGPMGAYRAVRAFRRARWFNDAAVWLLRDHLVIGMENPVMYEQTPRRAVKVRKLVVTVKLCSRRKTEDGNKETETLHEDSITLIENAEAAAHTPLRAQGRIPIPPDLPPNSPKKARGFPRYWWTLHAKLEIENGPAYESEMRVAAQASETARTEERAAAQTSDHAGPVIAD